MSMIDSYRVKAERGLVAGMVVLTLFSSAAVTLTADDAGVPASASAAR